MPIVDLLPVAKRSNVENRAGDTSYRNCLVCGSGYSTLMLTVSENYACCFEAVVAVLAADFFSVYLVYVPKLYFIVP